MHEQTIDFSFVLLSLVVEKTLSWFVTFLWPLKIQNHLTLQMNFFQNE